MIKHKLILFSLLLFFIAGGLKAQTSLSVAENFMVKDTDGQTHHLFDILDEGKIAVLTFFTTT